MPFNNSKINMAAQSDFLRKHGEWILHSLAMKCNCSILPTGADYPDSNRANPNCVTCKGLGMFWMERKSIWGAVQSVNQQKDLLMTGVATPGDLVLSPDPRYLISDYDKITMEWREGIPYEGELVIRSSTGSKDTTNYQIVNIIACTQVSPDTGDVTTFNSGIDFTFSGKEITWIGNAPAANSFYAIKYSAVVEWICFAPPQPRMERGTNLGQRVVMRKKHMIVFGQ